MFERLPIQPMKSKSCLANGVEFPFHGNFTDLLSMNNVYYTVSFSVVSQLICFAVIGLHVHSQYKAFEFGRKNNRLNVSNWTAIAESNEFRQMVIDQPKLLSDEVYRA